MMLMMTISQMSKVETAGDCGRQKKKKKEKDDPWLSCTTQFSCCHALNYALKQQRNVLCMFTNPNQKGIFIGFQHILFMSGFVCAPCILSGSLPQ